MIAPTQDRYISVDEASDLIGLPKSTLYGWRSRAIGPRSVKFLGRVVYRLSDFTAWIESQEATTSRGGRAPASPTS